MTRVIAGRFGGRTLATPRGGAGGTTRPTTDRVREALFSRLEHLDALAGAAVLDLYAGSGALAFEALSRGATRAVLVEAARPVAQLAARNATTLGCAPEATVVTARALRFLGADRAGRDHPPAGDGSAHPAAAGPFGLVLADPPYDVTEPEVAQVLAALAAPGRLADDAVVVIERSSRSPEPAWPGGLERFDERTYGETRLWFAEPDHLEPPGGAASP